MSTVLPPFPELYRTHFREVWSALLRLGVPSEAIEDAVHDVFMVVHRRADAFEGRASVRTWLLGIARRIASRYRRTVARTERRHRALAQIEPTAIDLDEHVARKEGWRALVAFLEQLDGPKREAFVLGELEQLPRRELGVALGVKPDTAYSRLRAARARFSETFAQDPAANAALAAGRTARPVPPRARQRVWLALAPGVMPKGLGVAGAVKIVAATLGIAVGGLTAVAGINAAVREPPRAPTSADGVMTERSSSTVEPAQPSDERPLVPVDDGTTKTIADAPGTGSPGSSDRGHRADSSERSRARSSERARPGPASDPTPESSPSPPATSAVDDPSGVDADALLAETALLQQARAALARSESRRALTILQRHRTRFPASPFAEEREASEIRARCALGQWARARDSARRLVQSYPDTAYLDGLEEDCLPR